jgi:hypothetical protein
MRKWIASAAIVMLAGCLAPVEESPSVVVAPYQVLTAEFDNLKDFVATRTIVATGKVIAVNDLAYEAAVDPSAEGNIEGEGPEIYGTIELRLETVIKGDVKSGSTLTLVYLSGKWNSADRKGLRIAYTHEQMGFVQSKEGGLKSPAELKDLTFIVFAAPKPPGLPVEGDLHVAEIAVVDDSGTVAFSHNPPFKASGGSTATSLTQVREASR